MSNGHKKDPKPTDHGEIKSAESNIVYLDAAATSFMPESVIDEMIEFTNRGNPSGLYRAAEDARTMMDNFRHYIADQCDIKLDGPKGFTLLFTSGASESNCHILTGAVRAFAFKTGKLPHLIVSAIEHKSLLACALRLAKEKLTELTVIPVHTAGEEVGAVDMERLERSIRPNTCLVSIMAANNETGILNDIALIGATCARKKVPFHTDAVQMFGKVSLRPDAARVDAFSLTMHKLHGPPGVGVLAVRNTLISGYGLGSHICGSQNFGLRGGTENVPGIAAAFAGLRLTFTGRQEKVQRVAKLRETIRAAISTRFPTYYLGEYKDGLADAAVARAERGGPAVVVWIAPRDTLRLIPGTLFLSCFRPRFCNKKARAALEAQGVIVSLGSACNSSDDHASSTVEAMNIPVELRPGVIRVSLGDDSTVDDVKQFIKAFFAVVSSHECLADPGPEK